MRRIVLLIIHYSIDLRGLRDNNKIYMTMNKNDIFQYN